MSERALQPEGIVYSVSGEPYLAEAVDSARSSLRFNDVPHVIFADTASAASYGAKATGSSPAADTAEPATDPRVSLRAFDADENPFADKIRTMLRSPFQRSIFLDSDTHVVDQITHLFALLDRFDMAAAFAPGYRGRADPEVPIAFYEFNTGVIAWRAGAASAAFLEDWLSTYQRMIREQPFPPPGASEAMSSRRFAAVPGGTICASARSARSTTTARGRPAARSRKYASCTLATSIPSGSPTRSTPRPARAASLPSRSDRSRPGGALHPVGRRAALGHDAGLRTAQRVARRASARRADPDEPAAGRGASRHGRLRYRLHGKRDRRFRRRAARLDRAARRRPTRHVAGRVSGSRVDDVRDDAGVRRRLDQRGEVAIVAPSSPSFTLVIKHPAVFTALLESLRERFPVFAIVRNPLAVLGSWESVPMPMRDGSFGLPAAMAPALAARLAGIADVLERQLKLLSWYFQSYLALLPLERVIRYEDMIDSGGGGAGGACPERRRTAAGESRQPQQHACLRSSVSGASWSAAASSSAGALAGVYPSDEIERLSTRPLASASASPPIHTRASAIGHDHRPVRIAMLLHKSVEFDSRVRREASALAAAGHDVMRGRAGGRCRAERSARRLPPALVPAARVDAAGCRFDLYRLAFLSRSCAAVAEAVPTSSTPTTRRCCCPGVVGARLTGARLVYDSHELATGVPVPRARLGAGSSARSSGSSSRAARAVITVSDGIAAAAARRATAGGHSDRRAQRQRAAGQRRGRPAAAARAAAGRAAGAASGRARAGPWLRGAARRGRAAADDVQLVFLGDPEPGYGERLRRDRAARRRRPRHARCPACR